ncbi:hypothetical protein NHX12_027248 [Muraenolepis orangiensis]|uniref:Nipped-B protein n=1 Tax=Muraenolepis orangiensis TaxID=630683 RepID=A0A9Q0EF26_9TELE|nr:hypothetical protein NHX12_027248 [Muraenolepis orangiensis]
MVTALVLQLIQCLVQPPSEKPAEDKTSEDRLVTSSYQTAMKTAQNFLLVFLKKCAGKQGENDFRPVFEHFLQDLLVTVNRPDWPGAELLLSLLGRLLVHHISTKQTEVALRVASLDYLGTVAAHLRKDAMDNTVDRADIDRILKRRLVPGRGEDTPRLQSALLIYLEHHGARDVSLEFARRFYVARWLWDASKLTTDAPAPPDATPQPGKKQKATRKVPVPPQRFTPSVRPKAVDYADACLIARYLASSRPFAKSFGVYLTQILRVLGESAIGVRTKAMKCLSEVVAVDPTILTRSDMRRGVHGRLMDSSISVREAAVELVGHFVLSRPQLTEKYYDMLVERILDTGVSVRKRVIKILRDVCLEQPAFDRVTDVCVRMIRRVSDEEGIKKLVNETFQKMWFTPSHRKEAMKKKILVITDVVSACRDSGNDWFEQLLQNLLKSEEETLDKPATKACVQLVDHLVEHILTLEEASRGLDDGESTEDPNHLISSLTVLYLFTKTRPRLLVNHAAVMQPYLARRCNRENDYMVICVVAQILELVVPLLEEPSLDLLLTIEEDLMRLIIKHGVTVVQRCVSCLGTVVNQVSHNYTFVWACFNRYYGALIRLKVRHQENPNSTALAAQQAALLRALLTVGALCRHFDFDQDHFKGANTIVIKDRVLEVLLHFTTHREEEVQIKAIMALGSLFVMHPSLMFLQEVRALYTDVLSAKEGPLALKVQVLKNLQTYLQEEDSSMLEADRDWKKLSKQEDLKEMGDVTSGMSSSIMQLYLKPVLEAFFHPEASVRHFALSSVVLTLSQGIIHPVQCVPYLIAMGTDPDPTVRIKADQQLADIDKKYSGFIHMKAAAGMKMAYRVQQVVGGSDEAAVRGFDRRGDSDSAVCSHLYCLVRPHRLHRRAFLMSLLGQFDDSAKTEVNVLLFTADNLACFPYQSQEEPLFIMHHVDIMLSVSGSNLLQSFKEHLKTLYGFSDGKIQKYSPTDLAKAYDKAVHRKSGVLFEPRQTLDFLQSGPVGSDLGCGVKRVVQQFLDFKQLMEHLDRDGEDEEQNTGARNRALAALLGPAPSAKPRPAAPTEATDDPGGRRAKAAGDAAGSRAEVMEMVALCVPGKRERPQIARVVQRTSGEGDGGGSYTVHWMNGSYIGPWSESQRNEGGKLVPLTTTVRESDVIYRNISLTGGGKLGSKLGQTLQALYTAKGAAVAEEEEEEEEKEEEEKEETEKEKKEKEKEKKEKEREGEEEKEEEEEVTVVIGWTKVTHPVSHRRQT